MTDIKVSCSMDVTTPAESVIFVVIYQEQKGE